MSNRTYICLDCRTARRAECAGWLHTDLRCRSCRGPLWELSRKWRIPKMTNLKGWEELRRIVSNSRAAREEFIRERGDFHLGEIERKMADYSARKPSKKRDAVLKDLEKKRARVLRLYFTQCVRGVS